LDCVDRYAVEVRANAEVEVGLRTGNHCAEIGVAVADADDGGLAPLIWTTGGVSDVVLALLLEDGGGVEEPPD
jgi:hypothetical protein